MNRIQAGNLDIEVAHQNGNSEGYDEVDLDTHLFSDVTLWEPGVVTYENIRIENVGNLAAKVKLSLKDVIKNTYNGHDLTEVIKVAVVDGGFSGSREDAKALNGYTSLAGFDKSFSLLGKTSATTDSKTYGIVLYWQPTENDNLYNLKDGAVTDDGKNYLEVQFGLDVVATQNTVERDSFDEQYDKDATYPTLGTILNTTTEESASGLTLYSSTTTDSEGALIGDAPIIISDSGKLEKTIKTTAATTDSTTYDISYNYVEGDTSTPVVAFDKVRTNTIQLSSGLKNVNVTHSHGTVVTYMIPGTAEEIVDGTYYYNEDTGVLTIHSKIYSEFKIDYTSDYVATIDSQGYIDLQSAVDSVENGQTVYLLKNVYGNNYCISKAVEFTLDLNKKTVDGQIKVDNSGCNLTLQNGIITYNGTASENATIYIKQGRTNLLSDLEVVATDHTNGYAISVYGEVYTNNVIVDSQYYGFAFFNSCKAELNNTIVNSYAHAISTAEAYSNSAMNVIINNGEYICTNVNGSYNDPAIYWAGYGKLVVNGGIFKSKAVNGKSPSAFIKNGVIEINGGEFIDSHDALKITSEENNSKLINVTVNGGTFNGVVRSAVYVKTTSKGQARDNFTVTLNGGVFNGETKALYTSFDTNFKPELSIKGGLFNKVIDSSFIANGYGMIEDGNYWRVVEAIPAAEAIVLKSEAYNLSGGSAIRKTLFLNDVDFIFEVNDVNSFANDAEEMKITIVETQSTDPEAWTITFSDDTVKYYEISIDGLTSEGDPGWPNLYIKNAKDASYNGSKLDWNGWGYSVSIEGYDGSYFMAGGIQLK